MRSATPATSAISKVPLFVYGTLMSPVVMESLLQRRVHGHPVRLLPSSYEPGTTTSVQGTMTKSNAELRYDYSRHPVRGAVYPGLVHWNANSDCKSIKDTSNHVYGLLYSTLTDAEMRKLDEFEGDQYSKELCFVQLQPNDNNQPADTIDNDDVIQAMVYVWSYPLSDLDLSKGWSYTTFEEQHLSTYL